MVPHRQPPHLRRIRPLIHLAISEKRLAQGQPNPCSEWCMRRLFRETDRAHPTFEMIPGLFLQEYVDLCMSFSPPISPSPLPPLVRISKPIVHIRTKNDVQEQFSIKISPTIQRNYPWVRIGRVVFVDLFLPFFMSYVREDVFLRLTNPRARWRGLGRGGRGSS